MKRLLPSCKDVSHLSSRAMDESLSWRERIALRMHLSLCVWCRRNTEQMRLISSLARCQAADESKDVKLTADERARLARFLDRNDDPS